MPNVLRSISLFYQNGSSDKVYVLEISQQSNDGYLVSYANGRRGSPLKQALKTPAPVSLIEAEKIFEKQMKEKLKKGYQESGDGGTTLAPAPQEKSRISLQLLNPIDESEAERLCRSHDWVAQEKHDNYECLSTPVINTP